MSTNTTTNTNKSKTLNPTERKWFALLRLVCYVWVYIVLVIFNHYTPQYTELIEPATRLVFGLGGFCLGRNFRLFFPHKA